MNRKKIRKLLDSMADQLLAENDSIILVLEELRADHEDKLSKALESGLTRESGLTYGWHRIMIHKINKAIELVRGGRQ